MNFLLTVLIQRLAFGFVNYFRKISVNSVVNVRIALEFKSDALNILSTYCQFTVCYIFIIALSTILYAIKQFTNETYVVSITVFHAQVSPPVGLPVNSHIGSQPRIFASGISILIVGSYSPLSHWMMISSSR